MPETLLDVRDLKMHLHVRERVLRAVDGVTFEVSTGRTLGIVGESGSGKSATALTLMRLIPMPPGRIAGGSARYRELDLLSLSDRDMRRLRGDQIAMVFQDPMTSLNPVYRIGRQVAEPLVVHRGMTHHEGRTRAIELLELVGIPKAASRVDDYPHQFSGGMRQRVMIAMALACDPALLIADEPTTALDVTIQAQIIELLGEIQRLSGLAIVLISHDLGVIAGMADDVNVMYAGGTVESGSADQIFYEPAHPYTWGLLDSVPRSVLGVRERQRPIAGQPPSPLEVPAGCAFHPRCSRATGLCRTEEPMLRQVGAGHRAACHFSGEPGFVRDMSMSGKVSG